MGFLDSISNFFSSAGDIITELVILILVILYAITFFAVQYFLIKGYIWLGGFAWSKIPFVKDFVKQKWKKKTLQS